MLLSHKSFVKALCCFCFLLSAVSVLLSQAPLKPATPLLTQPIHEERRVVLQGSAAPLSARFSDQGRVEDSFPVSRAILVLKSSPERQADLQQFMKDVHTIGGANYHQWVTPEQFGERFGPADSDVQVLTQWLRSHGLNVASVSKSKRFVEISGTAGQMRSAFRTDLHRYVAGGQVHYANAVNAQVPEALSPIIGNLSPITTVHAKPQAHLFGRAHYEANSRRAVAEFTLTNPNFYALAPEDFATQYNLKPLYGAGVTGSGQKIGIINVSNIDIGLVNNYRSMFGLASNPPQVVVDGGDPTINDAAVEAYLDVEVSGSVAPDADVILYTSDGGGMIDPLLLASARAISDNQASVLSVSFGSCEAILGKDENSIWAGLWEQAAAQGQTVLVSSGDDGSAGCDDFNTQQFSYEGLAVNGLASTPWNVAVGGTDFYYSDYATGGNSAATKWNLTNTDNRGSLIAPLTEQVWNDAFGFNSWGPYSLETSSIVAASGGASGVYTKPSWQVGRGVPNDSARDLPDVSLFAADGANASAYPVCLYAGDCVDDGYGNTPFYAVGGTSASTPAMAGIMALVNQRYGRQGQANFTLYPLAQQHPAAFHDVTIGSTNVPCQPIYSTDCVVGTDPTQPWYGFYSWGHYLAGPGYDLASGLGTVDAHALVSNWASISFHATTTSLQISPTTAVHGSPLNVNAAVTSSFGTPSGPVSILTNSPLPAQQSITFGELGNGGIAGTLDSLPGGTYEVYASYGGDGVFGASKSGPVSVTISPEPSAVQIAGAWLDSSSKQRTISSGSQVPYGVPTMFGTQVVNSAGDFDGAATGTMTFTDGSSSLQVPLTSAGTASWFPDVLAIGSHAVNASFSGDPSFAESSSGPLSFTVTRGDPALVMDTVPNANLLEPNGSVTVSVMLGTGYGDVPTGNVQFNYDSTPYQFVPLTPFLYNGRQFARASYTFTNIPDTTRMFVAAYLGDSNWQSDTAVINPLFATGSRASTTTTLAADASSLVTNSLVHLQITVHGGSPAPSGTVTLRDNNIVLGTLLLTATGANTSTAELTVPASQLLSGSNQIDAIYDGDSANASSTSNVLTMSVDQGDFSVSTLTPTVTIPAGSLASVNVTLSSLWGFNGIVAVSCTPLSAQLTCSATPASPTLNGTTTVQVGISVASGTTPNVRTRAARGSWILAGTGMAFACFFLLGCSCRKPKWVLTSGMVLLLLLFMTACGGGNSPSFGGPTPTPTPTVTPHAPADPGAYSVLVTGRSSGGLVHNTRITVVVR